MLNEAANVCRIDALPDLYSFFGSQGISVTTILQSYKQGVRVWGKDGMDALWSAASVAIAGAGLKDIEFCKTLSDLVGRYEVDKRSRSTSNTGSSQSTSTHGEPILRPEEVAALPKSKALLFSSGASPVTLTLKPWYTERDADKITDDNQAATRGEHHRRGGLPRPPQPPRPSPSSPGTRRGAVTMSSAAVVPDKPDPLAALRLQVQQQARQLEMVAGVVDEMDAVFRDLPAATVAAGAALSSAQTGREDQLAEPASFDFATLYTWVHIHVATITERKIAKSNGSESGIGVRWCTRWYHHDEAIARLEALRRAWDEHVIAPGAGMSTWYLSHYDPHITALTAPSGPFWQFSPGHHQTARPMGHDLPKETHHLP